MSSVLKLFWCFLPSWSQIAILALFALLVILIVFKIIKIVLDAIPFV